MALSVSLQEVGRRQLLHGSFDEYGDAVAFAPDAVGYREGASALAGVLRAGELRRWIGSDYPFHVKLYSVCFALFGWLLGFGVVGAEPLNLLFYLASLTLVFGLGREVFEGRAGLLAAAAVALWPSLLLHTTQLVKDSLFIALSLALVLLVVRWTTRDYSWAGALRTAAAGALLAVATWFARPDMAELIVMTVLLGALTLAARLLRERRARAPNVAAMALLVAVMLCVPLVMPHALKLGSRHEPAEPSGSHSARLRAAEEAAGGASGLLARTLARVGRLRSGFAEMYPDAGSNVDAGVEIDGAADLLRYLPRAAEIGFFAPFPNMWLTPGRRVGFAGRLLAGVESLLIYFVEGLALAGLWAGRRRLAAWLLFSVAAAGMTALGLVVVNVGALYRLRYPFLVLLVVLAAGGACEVLGRMSKRERAAPPEN